MADCNVVGLCITKCLLFEGGAAMGPETIGRLPFRTGRKYSPVLAVTVVSSCS